MAEHFSFTHALPSFSQSFAVLGRGNALAGVGAGAGRHGESGPVQQLVLDIGLSAAPTLENFRAGANAAALAHVRSWAGAGGHSSGGVGHAAQDADFRPPSVPTYLWGETGCGKSHLLRAATGALCARGTRVGWLGPASAAAAVYQDDWGAIVLDDVHLFDASLQQTAFNWFVNAMAPPSGPARGVLAAGAVPPADLDLREDLRTRLGWGHVFQLHAPDEAGRRAVLREQADARGLLLGDDTIDFMLRRFSRDLGSLSQLLDRLDTYALRTQRGVTPALVRSMMENA